MPTDFLYILTLILCLKLPLFRFFRQMELIRLVEHLAHLIYFKESSARRIAQSEAAAKISNLIVERDVALLAEHTQSRREHIVSRSLFLLVDRNHAVAQVKPALSLEGPQRYGRVGGAYERQLLAARIPCLCGYRRYTQVRCGWYHHRLAHWRDCAPSCCLPWS